MNIEKRRAEIAARKAEIRKLIEGDTENKLNMDDLETVSYTHLTLPMTPYV